MVKIRPHSISILGGLLFAANAVMAQLPPPPSGTCSPVI